MSRAERIARRAAKAARKKEMRRMDANKIFTVPEPISCFNVLTRKPIQRELEEAIYGGEGDKRYLMKPAKTENDAPWPLYRFMAIFVAQRPDWQKPLDKAIRLTAFLQKLDETEVGKTIEVRGDLWRDLRDTLQGDDFELPYPYNMQLPPLAMAILDARDVQEEATEPLKEVPASQAGQT